MYSKLQYISQGKEVSSQLYNIQAALDAGCKWIQLRYKQADEPSMFSLAVAVKKLCDHYKAILIINDFVSIAREVDADGVHVGLSDTPVPVARKKLEPGKIIGGTANTLADVEQRISEQCDYIGLGPYRFTATKEKLSPILGLDGYRDIMNVLAAKNSFIPVYAIGGILSDDITAILSTGVHGIAVSGMVTNAPDKHAVVSYVSSL